MKSITFWSRLEPITRARDFTRGLMAQVRDPLWMLTRQWQLGEFRGEDAGTSAWAMVKTQEMPITHIRGLDEEGFRLLAGSPSPIEVVVEQEPFYTDKRPQGQNGGLSGDQLRWNITKIFDAKARAEIGLEFMRKLGGVAGEWTDKFLELFPFPNPDKERPTDFEIEEIEEATLIFFQSMTGRIVDGASLYYKLVTELRTTDIAGPDKEKFKALLGSNISDPELEKIATVCRELVKWCKKWYQINEKLDPGDSYWRPQHLEYGFSVAAPAQGNQRTVLKATEYYEGELDWYSFSLDKESDTASPDGEQIQKFVPTPCQFPGMPDFRWWRLEDSKTDFGDIDVNKTDLAKMLLMEFSLIYGNDWLVFPYPLEIGRLCKIKYLVVTDIFGQHIIIQPADEFNQDERKCWSMFKLSAVEENRSIGSNLFFLPPTLEHVLESPPVEKVTFLRDEMANMVWAVEQTLPNGLGEGVSGYELYLEKKAKLDERNNSQAEQNEKNLNKPSITYKLQSLVPENWIPFVPVREQAQGRKINLKHAYMLGEDGSKLGLPRGIILRPQDAQYTIYEEEIRRTGVSVMRTVQRARWIDGSTYVWMGRRKRPGKGEGASGLKFDMVVDVNE